MATNTTNTFTNHTGNGTEVNFSISFSYILTSDIDVTVAGVTKTLGTHYTISGSTVTFTSGNVPANGAAIKFQRDTSISTKAVDFQDGSVLTEQDLDNNTNQVLFAQQEINDKLANIEEGATADQTAAEIRTLVESASDSNVFTDADHSKLNNIEANATQDQTASEIKSLIAGSPLDASHLAANSVDSSELVDGSVDTSHLSASCVTTDKITGDAITGAKIADDSIDSEHYVDGSIDSAHIGNNQVITAKIADANVTSTKLATGAVTVGKLDQNSVRTVDIIDANVTSSKLATGAVTSVKLDNNAVTTAKIADNQITAAKIANNAVTTDKIQDAELTTLAGMQSATASKLADSTALTSDIADLNQLDGMAKQTTITNSDNHFPTSGAVVDFVADQIAPVGGLEVIADEDNFPTTQPVSGVVISISNADGLVINSSGVATNARTVGSGSDNVTINNFPTSLRSKTLSNELGLLVSSTGASQIYNYHKLLAKETDVLQLSEDINDFGNRYRVVSQNPTSDNDAGDLIFNTSTQKLLVYNATSGAFEEAQSVGNFFISTLSPAFNGSVQDFTITNAPSNAQQIILSINGVIQKPNAGTSTPSEGFALSGNTVKLAAAPASGSDYFAIVLGSTVNVGTPSDNTVTSAILQNGSVIEAKLGSGAVTRTKLNLVSTSSVAGLEVKGDGSSDGYLQLNCSQNSHGIKLKSPPHSASASYTLTLPNNIVNGQFLTTDANGNLSWAAVTTDLVNDSSPQLGGSLDVNNNNISFVDSNGTNNNRATFGASNDMAIFHDGSNSRIKETGTGHLILSSDGAGVLVQADNGQNLAKFLTGGATELYYNYVKQLSTRSDGIEIHAAEGGEAMLYLTADEGDDSNDKYRLVAQNGGDLVFQRHTGSAYSSELRLKSAGGIQANYQGNNRFETVSAGFALKEGNTTRLSFTYGNSLNFITANAGNEIKLSCGNGDANGIEFWDYSGVNKRCQIDGHGIKFNADTAQANALNDYEEGTFNAPYYQGGTFLANADGRYTKIGNRVMISIFEFVSGQSTKQDKDLLYITGLPFAARSEPNSLGTIARYGGGNHQTIGTAEHCYIAQGGTQIKFDDTFNSGTGNWTVSLVYETDS